MPSESAADSVTLPDSENQLATVTAGQPESRVTAPGTGSLRPGPQSAGLSDSPPGPGPGESVSPSPSLTVT